MGVQANPLSPLQVHDVFGARNRSLAASLPFMSLPSTARLGICSNLKQEQNGDSVAVLSQSPALAGLKQSIRLPTLARAGWSRPPLCSPAPWTFCGGGGGTCCNNPFACASKAHAIGKATNRDEKRKEKHHRHISSPPFRAERYVARSPFTEQNPFSPSLRCARFLQIKRSPSAAARR